jgi:hypothetical protein
MGVYPGSSRREDNHARNERSDPKQAIKQRQRGVQIRREREAESKAQTRKQRNNFREW